MAKHLRSVAAIVAVESALRKRSVALEECALCGAPAALGKSGMCSPCERDPRRESVYDEVRDGVRVLAVRLPEGRGHEVWVGTTGPKNFGPKTSLERALTAALESRKRMNEAGHAPSRDDFSEDVRVVTATTFYPKKDLSVGSRAVRVLQWEDDGVPMSQIMMSTAEMVDDGDAESGPMLWLDFSMWDVVADTLGKHDPWELAAEALLGKFGEF